MKALIRDAESLTEYVIMELKKVYNLPMLRRRLRELTELVDDYHNHKNRVEVEI